MVTLGADTHKASHTLVAVDDNGRQVAQRTVAATAAGHLDALGWATQWPERMWAIEDCRNLSRALEADLLRAGEGVVRVAVRLMAAERRGGRAVGKSDPIDALAVARAALREPNLPVARLEGPEREVRLLVDHREDLVAERTRIQNRVRWHLHEVLPGAAPAHGTLDRAAVVASLEQQLATVPGMVARLARELLGRMRELTRAIVELEREIARLVKPLAPTLLALLGCGALTAAKLIGETASIEPVSIEGSVCSVQRHGADPGLVEQHRTGATQPGWQSSAQRRPAPYRGHPAPALGPGTSLRRAPPARR